ncbi:MAG: hypothetical protein IPJ19_13395 [Planctomycetes bacterium]|nr:hypothetical protein [Planctomycetota bacterium]
MKSAHAWIVTGLFLASAFTLARAGAAQDPDDVFRTQFLKALEGAQKPEQQKLVKQDPLLAELWIVRSAESVAEDPGSKDKAFYDALAEAWKGAWKCEFPERELKYLQGLDAAKKKTRAELFGRWKPALREFTGNLEKKDGMVFANLVDEVDALSGAFDSEGDLYHASEAYRTFAMCYDETLRGAAGDLHRAWIGYGHAIEMRDKLDLKDPVYDELTKRYAALGARGAGEKGGATPGAVEPKQDGPKNAPVPASVIPMTFDMLTSPDAITRPIYGCDEIYEMWNGLGLQIKGTVATFPTNTECPPIVRTGSSDLRFDTDGDKQGDEKIPMTGNIAPVRVPIGQGEKQRPWAFFAVSGTQQDSFQGIQVNLAPDDRQYQIYTLGAASMIGTFGTTSLRMVDDSLDGIYGNEPQRFGTQGMTDGEYEPWLDSIVVGSGKRARPWSGIQEIDGNFYRLEVQERGAKLAISPAGVDTGVLKLDFKGSIRPTYLVVVGSSELKDCYFDLVEGGAKGVRVPTGNYSLFYGELRKGKKKQMQKALILPPASNGPSWSVRKGETTTVTLGAPFVFDFRYEVNGSKLKVIGKSVVVLGSAGEHYERLWNCVSRPEIAWRKKGSRATLGDSKMPVADYSTIENKDLSWPAVWFPLDLEADTKDKGGGLEVQLVQKKHDLFGKVESPWKE